MSAFLSSLPATDLTGFDRGGRETGIRAGPSSVSELAPLLVSALNQNYDQFICPTTFGRGRPNPSV